MASRGSATGMYGAGEDESDVTRSACIGWAPRCSFCTMALALPSDLSSSAAPRMMVFDPKSSFVRFPSS